ncbi:efflux RND transporter periplasmic adaptor subunit [Sulfitobacter sp. JB4-11]|uniref:efflux RND transporter periplasmic adaptor subunit n=1 Tax=Sulfitobacter rhodophyticola TaxID=3238304 RepID=UPI003D8189E1
MSTPQQQGLLMRVLRKIASIIVTLGVIGASIAAIAFGAQALANRAEDVPPPAPADVAKVAVTPLVQRSGYVVERQYVGQTEATATMSLSFELGGRLAKLLAEEGDEVAAGQVLMRLDTALLEAEKDRHIANRAAVSSQLVFAESQLARAEKLRKDGFTSQETLDQVRATRDELQSRMDEIKASLASVRINLEKSVISAPFAGRIGSQFFEEGAALNAGQPVAELIETDRVQVRIGLPLDLRQDALADARITVGGEAFPATLSHFRPDIDPITRTRTAVFDIDADADLQSVFGQTAVLRLKNEVSSPGAWVQVDALQEGAGGAWTLLMVEDGVVRPALVEILHADAQRAFVRGTFQDGALSIYQGAHRVVPGQSVQILRAGEG